MHTVFIVNSRIGSRKIALFTRSLLIHYAHIQHTVRLTQYPGHAQVIAQEALQLGAERIVAVGGDGTVNEIIQIVAESRATLGIIPCGSGNGLARHCGISLNIDKAMSMLVNGTSVKIDLGKSNEYYFISNAGVGFDGHICHQIRQASGRGLWMYSRYVTESFFSYQPQEYKLLVDGTPYTETAYFINVANGKEFGYGFQISPQASLRDGWLDLLIVKNINLTAAMRFVWDGWNKNLSNNPNTIQQRAKSIQITSSSPLQLQTDGDARDCARECNIFVISDALSIIVPTPTPIL